MPSDPSKPSQLSCTSCRHRKVKCDKAKPCSACRRSNVECVFPNRPFKPRGRQGGSKARNAEITQRLQRLEGLVGKLGGENSAGTPLSGGTILPSIEAASHRQGNLKERQNSSSQSPRSQDFEPISQSDGTRYLGNDFWSSMSSEVDGLKQLLEAPSEDEEEEWEQLSSQSPSVTPFPDTLFIFGSRRTASDLRSLHPFAPGIGFLCSTYFQNVDPLFKVLHRPTVQVAVSAAADSLNAGPLEPAQEALMFAMYFAAITSLTQEQCQANMGQDRDILLAQFKYGVETALANAHFLSSTELKALVAFAIYVMCLRSHNESRTAWTLVGLAIRIAYSLELNSEAAVSAFSPFEAELRRRLWFALCVLDVRSSEDRGVAPMIIKGTFDTKMACNVNDADLDPLSFTDVTDRLGCTEMTFCLVTHESSAFARRQAFPDIGHIGLAPVSNDQQTLDEQRADTEQFRKHLESKYLVYCDETVPIFWVAKRVARLIGLKMELLLQYPLQPKVSNSNEERNKDGALERACDILEMANEAESSEVPANFRWFIKTYPQWHPLAVALAELCSKIEGPAVDRAWAIVDVVFDKLGSRIADSKKGSLWRPIKKLHTRAQTARSQHLSKQQQQHIPLPPTSFNDLASLKLTDPIGNTNAPMPKQEEFGFDFSAPPDTLPTMSLDQSMDSMNWGGWDEFLQNANGWDGQLSGEGNGGVQWTTELGLNAMFP